MSFDGLLPALQMKKIDAVIAGMSATPERKKAVAFSKPYFKAKQVVITKGVDKSLKSFKDLSGKKVGVMLGFTGDTVVSEIKGVKVERFNASYAAIMALSQNKVDAVVLDSEPAKKYTANNKQFVMNSSIRNIALSENGNKIGVNDYNTKFEYNTPNYAPVVEELPILNLNSAKSSANSDTSKVDKNIVSNYPKFSKVEANNNSTVKALPKTGVTNTTSFTAIAALGLIALMLYRNKKNN